MNRKIIFRGKSLDLNEWVYGDLQWYEEECMIEGVQVHPETVGQFVCLDRWDEPIYEGDIIHSSKDISRDFKMNVNTGEVIWSERKLAFMVRGGITYTLLGDLLKDGAQIHVLRNIYS
jgi:hypothetical protein